MSEMSIEEIAALSVPREIEGTMPAKPARPRNVSLEEADAAYAEASRQADDREGEEDGE